MKDFYNPLIGMDYPDPDLIRVGDIWYMISTTMHFMPGGEILRSYNLTDWERVGYGTVYGEWRKYLRTGYVGSIPAVS